MRRESIKVTVTMPERLFSKLADLGEVYDMRVDELMLELSAQALAKRAPDLSHPVVSRWREGWSDRLIAIDLGMTNASVAHQRRKHGLPANSNRGGLRKVKADLGLRGAVSDSAGRVASPTHTNTSPTLKPANGRTVSQTSSTNKWIPTSTKREEAA